MLAHSMIKVHPSLQELIERHPSSQLSSTNKEVTHLAHQEMKTMTEHHSLSKKDELN
jgi:hypothetical protein